MVEAALRERIETSMFPLSNLRRYGMDDDHPRSMSFWVSEAAHGRLNLLGVTRGGVVMPSCPDAGWPSTARALNGRGISGVIGARAQARPLIDALGISDLRTELDADEPQFALHLDDLVIPGGPGTLRPLDAMPRAMLIDWRRRYRIEMLGTQPEAAEAQATEDVEGYLAEDTHRVLMDGATPLAMTGFNANLPDIVQIGGVYTPENLRSKGHARRALALHLREVRSVGVTRATLFASGPAAIRAYEALGFRRIGDWTLFMLRGETVIDV
jgi:RimJ/RimL family protein N-acetyltransferase